MVLFEFVLLCHDILGNRIGKGFLALWRTVIRQSVVDTEGERLLMACETPKGGLSILQLLVAKPCDGGADSGLGLEISNFKDLAFSFRFGAGRRTG
jgi:hypothetical protein